MNHIDFLSTQIKSLLLSDGKCAESEANAAVAHVMDYRRTHTNAALPALISRARFYVRHNRRPDTPPRTEPVKKAALPKRRQFS
jgi:hypothetical protein